MYLCVLQNADVESSKMAVPVLLLFKALRLAFVSIIVMVVCWHTKKLNPQDCCFFTVAVIVLVVIVVAVRS